MTEDLGSYSFLPWLRHGVANSIRSQDLDHSVTLRAAIGVDVAVTGTAVGEGDDLTATISQNVALYGPGDIVGIDSRAIVRNEPRHWITNFEPNYLPYVEFYDEDFPWRYTPAAPDTDRHRLRPWLALVVLKEDEFEEAATVTGGPPPAIALVSDPATVFPPAEQLWAWAHVHVNTDLIERDGVRSTDTDVVRLRLEGLLAQDPDQAYARIVSPRRLLPETGYHAFLVPTFESGRRAGLGVPPASDDPAMFATLSAWADHEGRPDPSLYPHYHRWYFKTGTVGDFEHLVRLLRPRPPDARLGRRDMDVQRPGSNIAGIAEPELGGVLRLGGALKVPDEALTDAEEVEAQRYEEWDDPYPHAFQRELAAFVNLAEDYAETTPETANADADLGEEIRNDPDPLITPPLYGRWHALTDRLLFEADGSDVPQPANWVHELNLDPRWRVAAGFGTAVVQDRQEEYMDAAWEQVGDIVEANRRLRQAQLATDVSTIWYQRHLEPLRRVNGERGLVVMAPVQHRVVAAGLTVRHTIERSIVPRAALSAPLRRIVRPRDHVAAALGFAAPAGPETLLARINDGEVSAAPPRVTPDDLPTVEEVGDELRPAGVPRRLLDWLRENGWAKYALLAIAILLALVTALLVPVAGPVLAAVIALAGIAAFRALTRLERATRRADAVLPEGHAPETIARLPRYPDFAVTEPGDAPEPTPGDRDSAEALRFKSALVDVHAVLSASAALGEPSPRPSVDVAGLAEATVTAIDPAVTIPRSTLAALELPARLVAQLGEMFEEAMAYPEFDTPMYKPLLDLSDEHFLPNIDRIPQNTITLLETNQRFIEAYMVGINHEFARELLWREYPTDQRGSYFRQFWDISGVRNTEGLSRDELREKLRDIPPLHRWSLSSVLGAHDHGEQAGADEDEVVMVVRGELLKKYPTAVIYAHRARWQLDDSGGIDPGQERILDTTGDVDDTIKAPLYEAKVDPDITFLGFDLTADDVKGGSGRGDDTDPGWFFVIKERPGEPRFGLDIERDGELNVWNDLAWPDVLEGEGFLQVTDATATIALAEPTAPELQDKRVQYEEDKGLTWHAGTNAAELAYILTQVPVLVAVHGSEMLPH